MASPDSQIEDAGAGVPPAGSLEQGLAALHKASFGWALACCRRDASTAEDVLQDVYCRVLDGRARFYGRSSFKTWLFGVIRMTAREHRRWGVLRLLRGGRADDGEHLEVADGGRAPDSEVAARQRAEHLARALSRIAARQREVLHLVFYEGLTIGDAAAVMGVSIGTARQHYERGKHALTAILEEDGAR